MSWTWRGVLQSMAGRTFEYDDLKEALRLERELADRMAEENQVLEMERDELRWLTRRCWAAWNDATLDDVGDDRRYPLDIDDGQAHLLHEVIEWTSLNPRPTT